jgi:hypothetical protein
LAGFFFSAAIAAGHVRKGAFPLARNNYTFEKRQKELARKKKKEEKLKRKREKNQQDEADSGSASAE